LTLSTCSTAWLISSGMSKPYFKYVSRITCAGCLAVLLKATWFRLNDRRFASPSNETHRAPPAKARSVVKGSIRSD
jgi:hypothetical protein